MKILNNTVVTTPIAHMCEFPENLIISGNVYTKSPLRPLPMQFAMIEDPDSSILLKDTYEISDTSNKLYRNAKNTYIEDEYNEGVVWIFYNENNIFRATPNEFGYEISKVNQIMFPADTAPSDLIPVAGVYFKYAFQTKDHIYCWWHNTPDNTNYLGKIDKQTLIWHNITASSLYTGYIEPIGYYYDELNDIYYHYCLHYDYTGTGLHYWYIRSINLNTGVKTTSYTSSYMQPSSNSKTQNRITPYVKKIDNSNGFIFSNNGGSSNWAKKCIYKYNITNTGTISVTYVFDSNFSKFGSTDIMKALMFQPQKNKVFYAEIYRAAGLFASNLMHLSKDLDLSATSISVSTSYYTDKIKNTHKDNILTCGSIANDKTVFFVSSTKISIWQWNGNEYNLTNEVEDNIERVGVDFNENIWIRNADKEVYTINTVYTDYEITISTDETDFDYLGKDISSTIKVKALNKDGVHISCRVKLKITGSALFTQNQAKEMELELPGQELEIPITIYDTGIIHIAAIS